MLTDTSLTNVLIVSGVSQIRYRSYTLTCQRRDLVDALRRDRSPISSLNTGSADPTPRTLMASYQRLVELSIPCMWRVLPASPGSHEDITLELWVFWFDEVHTGPIDEDKGLRLLQEWKVGSFTWENVYAKSLSPNESPDAPNNRRVLATVAEEYKLFIESIRNLLRREIIHKGAIPLGNRYFLYPPSPSDHDYPTPETPSRSTSGLLVCIYHLYLASTNLIFQPSARVMQLAFYVHSDTSNSEVILAPTGEKASVIADHCTLGRSIKDEILAEWATFFDLPLNFISRHGLMMVRMETGEIAPYPKALALVKIPQTVPENDMNDLLDYLGRFSEDVGERWNRQSWISDVASTTMSNARSPQSLDTINFWNYSSPRIQTLSTVFDSLKFQHSRASCQVLLQKSLVESESFPPTMPSPLPRVHVGRSKPENKSNHDQKGNMSLAEYALTHFADEPKPDDMVQNYTPPVDEEHDTIHEMDDELKISTPQVSQQPCSSAYTPPASVTLPSHSLPLTSFDTSQVDANVADDLGLGFRLDQSLDDEFMHLSHTLDDDSLDLDIKDEDFEYFQQPMVVPSTLSTVTVPTKDELKMADTFDLDPLLCATEPSLIKASPLPSGCVNPDQDQGNASVLENDMMETMLISLHVETPANAAQSHAPATSTPIPSSLGETSFNLKPDEDTFHHDPALVRSLVPPDFAPVPFSAGVDDSKYCEGGKFTYAPTSPTGPAKTYRPDFVPRPPARSARKKTPNASLQYDQDRSHGDNSVVPMDMDMPSPTSVSSNESNGSYGSSTSIDSSESDMSTSMSRHDEQHDMKDLGHTTPFQDRGERFGHALGGTGLDDTSEWLLAQAKMHDCFVDLLLGHQTVLHKSTVHGQAIRLDSRREESMKALDYLCQQAVLGGYPFLGGIASLNGNGGEVLQGESVETLASRRRALVQRYCGGLGHAPSRQCENDYMLLDFKSILINLFDSHQQQQQQPTDDGIDPLDLALRGSVTVKGPLNVQQYYDLAETNQGHARYGKYQVKKRRPAEPNLDTLDIPAIMVRRQNDLLEGTPSMLTLWEKLRLEPYSDKKNVVYFAVYPGNDELEPAVAQFFKGLTTVYEACQLGTHYAGKMGPYCRGLAPVPLLPESNSMSWRERQIQSYMAECQNLGSTLGSATVEKNVHIVIYLVNPIQNVSSTFDMSRCFQKLMLAYQAASMGERNKLKEASRARVTMQIVPLEHLLRPTAFGGYTKFGLKAVAFSVYSKCHAVVTRQHHSIADDTRMVADMYAPPFVLTKAVPDTIPFSLKNSLGCLPAATLQQDATLQLAYAQSLDRRWTVLVWTDSWGELLEFSVVEATSPTEVFAEAWKRTKAIAQRTGYVWTIVIAKMGLIFDDELNAWTETLPLDANVAMVCLDLDSPFHVQTHFDMEHSDTSALSMASTPTGAADTMTGMVGSISSASNNVTAGNQHDATGESETQALVLNHRVAYSRHRERASFGIPLYEPDDAWVFPLASGYLVRSPPSNPSLYEEPPHVDLMVEIHLVHNQTQHSGYSTLRDIIKRFHALSHVQVMPTTSHCLPIHLVLVERLVRILMLFDT